MKKVLLLLLCAMGLWSLEIREVKPLYMQGEKLRPFIVFDNGTYDLFARLRLPNGKWFYVAPDGLHEEKAKYAHIHNNSSWYIFGDNKFIYDKKKWLPQGTYRLAISLESNGKVVDTQDVNFSFLSHTIAFAKFQGPTDYYKLLPSTNNTAWIFYEEYDSSVETKEKDRLFAMKIDKDANILIPPFEIGRCNGEPFASSNVGHWNVAGEKRGGFFLFYDVVDAVNKYHRNLIGAYFDAKGEKKVQNTLWRQSDENPYENVVAAYTDSERNLSVLVTFSSKHNFDMLLVHNGVRRISVSPKSENENFKSCYDAKEGKVYVIIEHRDTFTFYRYALDGTLEAQKDVTSTLYDFFHINFYYREKQKELFITDRGIVFLYPLQDALAYVLFDRDGNVLEAKRIAAPQLEWGHYDIVKHNGSFWMMVLNSSNMYLLSTDTKKIDFFSRMHISDVMDVYYPSIMEVGEHLFLTTRAFHYGEIHSYYNLLSYFFGNDKPLGEADLAIGKYNMVQRPYFARLGQDAELSFDVFNLGEANSTASTLNIEYMGKSYQKNIPVIEPRKRYELNISLPQPEYLTQFPTLSASIESNERFRANNSFLATVRFALDTPIYPPAAKMYNWSVVDSVDGAPIEHVRISYLHKNLRVVSGKRKDTRFVQRSDENGMFSTILEDGNYTFILSKFGGEYPKTIITKQIPPKDDRFLLQAAGDLHLDFTQEDGNALHPTPQSVAIAMQHQYSATMPDWQKYSYTFQGNENGGAIKRVMPGEYNLTIKAFGYEKKSVSGIKVESKKKKSYTIKLTPLPRGNICGKVVDAKKRGVSYARISLEKLPFSTTTDSKGNFCLQDLERGRSYILKLSKTDYLPFFYTFSLDEANLSVGELTLPKIDYKTIDLPKCRYGAWSQDLKWSDPKNSYEIKDLYGVWDMQGYLYYAQAQEQTKARLLMLNLNVDALLWMYWGLDGHFVEALVDWGTDVLGDVAEGAAEALGGTLKLVTKYVIKVKELKDFADDLSDWANMPQDYVAEYKNLSNPMGTVQGGVVDCGSLDTLGGLQMPTDSTPKEDKTVLRFDDIQVLYNDQVLYSTHQHGWRQYYTDTTPTITIPLNVDVDDLEDVRVKLYVAVMNGEYDSGPLALPGSDHLLLQYRVKDKKLYLEKIECSPPDYPSFAY